jgi:50S ribosomal protein L16 3-hydroxylase
VQFPDALDAASFLSRCWQKRAFFLPKALPRLAPSIESGELAWLATLPDVESRLVYTTRNGERTTYRVEHGPFDDSYLTALPAEDWTLLVQDVEKHLPEFRAQFAPFDFVPDWRIDDLMISVAAPGGSVGPHRDNYDVFLCQGEGTRQWQLAIEGSVEMDPDSFELSLLKPFRAAQQMTARQGDVLYLPPGVPHWGVAQEMCITYSVGMRAPQQSELHAACERLFPHSVDFDQRVCEPRYFKDPDLEADEAIPGLISPAAIRRVREQDLLPAGLADNEIAMVLGSVATDPKAWLAPEALTRAEAELWLADRVAGDGLHVHGMARLAYTDVQPIARFFANGFPLPLTHRQLRLVMDVCAHRRLCADGLDTALRDAETAELVLWMAMHGVFDAAQN